MMSYDEWMDGTYVIGYPRSAEMKAIDEAIKNFQPQKPSSRAAIKNALQAWKDKENKSGKRWQDSRRNGKKTIEKLDNELGFIIRARTPEELEALWQIRNGNEQNLKLLFAGKQLVVKKSKAASGAGAIASAAKSLEGSVKSGMGAAKAAVQGATPNQIVSVLSGGGSSTLGGSSNAVLSALTKAMPILNVVKGGVTLGAKLVSIGQGAWMKYRTAEQARSSFAPGDPAAALDAVQVMIGREMKETAVDAAGDALKLATDITALVTTGGIAAPIASYVADFAQNLSNLCYTVYLFTRDERESSMANKYLINGPWDMTLFKYSPILGCYTLACSCTSAIIAMSVKCYGRPGWIVDTEVMKKKADPLIDKAGELIRNSRYEIPELSHFKGIVPPSINKWSNLFLAKATSFAYELQTSKDEGAKFKPTVPTLSADAKQSIRNDHLSNKDFPPAPASGAKAG